MSLPNRILFFGFVFIFSGCVTLYKPNTIQSPLLKEKGELNASALLGISGSGLWNVQSAYALSDHTGFMIEGMHHHRSTNSGDSSVENFNLSMGEAGVGYFTKSGNRKNRLFQCYAGGGYGATSDRKEHADPISPSVNAKYFNLFIQPGIALINKNTEMSFDLRANYVNLYRIQASLYDQFEWWNTDFHFYSDTSLYFINLEPTFTMKAGGEKLRGLLQCGITIPSVHAHSYFVANTASRLGLPLFKFSVGIQYTFKTKKARPISSGEPR